MAFFVHVFLSRYFSGGIARPWIPWVKTPKETTGLLGRTHAMVLGTHPELELAKTKNHAPHSCKSDRFIVAKLSQGVGDTWMDNRIVDLLLVEFSRILNVLVLFECVCINAMYSCNVLLLSR